MFIREVIGLRALSSVVGPITERNAFRGAGAFFYSPAQYNVLNFIRQQHVCFRDASDRPSGQQKEDSSYQSGADTGKLLSAILNLGKLCLCYFTGARTQKTPPKAGLTYCYVIQLARQR